MTAAPAWFAAWLALVVAAIVLAARATARARAKPDDVVARGPFVAVAALAAAIVALAPWVWGGAAASESRDDRLRAGARVELALRGATVTIPEAAHAHGKPDAELGLVIGHGPLADVRVPGTGDAVVAHVVRDARGLVVRDACAPAGAAVLLPVGATLHAGACTATPLALRAVAPDRITVVPAGAAPRALASAGDALRIGRADDPVPALATWAVPAPSVEVIAVPADPTDCAAWPHARAVPGGCEVDAGALSFTAIPLVPDADAVLARATRAALAAGLPIVLACVVLACLARSRRRAPDLARVLRVAAIGGALAALACWRLVWAYRIDMLRDLAPAGARVADNELAAALIGATIAALCARRAAVAVAAWAAWLAACWLALGLGPAELTTARAAMLPLSLAAALAPFAPALARRLPRPPPDAVLLAIAAAAIAARALAPRGVLGKLSLAYALVVVGHLALRAAIARGSLVRRARMVGALAVAAAAVARYDTGVTVAIAGVGLAVAMLVAGYDAIYDDSNADKIGILEREHARLLVVHGASAIALAIAAAIAAAVAGDAAWRSSASDVACQAPLVAAALFAIAGGLARAHRRAWLPHALAALAALLVWTARADVVERATAGHSTASDRVAAVIEPGYALLRDGQHFAANASAWREAALPAADASAWSGEGLLGARFVDPGVVKSIDNDYLPVLVARDAGVGGIAQTMALLLALVAALCAFASAGLAHASSAHRSRWLVAIVIGALAVYQPMASLGVLPLTGISWPGLGIDSPSDLWLFVAAIAWCGFGFATGGERRIDDERVRATRRVVRARGVALAALAATACAGGVVAARSAATALDRVPADDARIAAALRYADGLACPWPARAGALDDVVPSELGGAPTDAGTTRFDRELRDAWAADRPALVAALAGTCRGDAGRWRLAATADGGCVAGFRTGGPELRLSLARDGQAWRASCSMVRDDVVAQALGTRAAADHGPRVRVVGEALGAEAADAGELVAGGRVVRLRAGAPAGELAGAPVGLSRAGSLALSATVRVDATASGLVLHGDAELFFAARPDSGDEPARWRRAQHGPDVPLDRVALVVAGPADHRVIAQVRPARAWPGGPPVADVLLADDAGRGHRTYPLGAALPELGWVNPYDVARSRGLDGWIHDALHVPAATVTGCSSATPSIARDRVCTPSPLDGVLECRVALQPELAAAVAALADRLAATPAPLTGNDSLPTRVGVVVLRGDTGEILAQTSLVPGRAPLAYAPRDADAEAALVALVDDHGDSDRLRAEWNLPIAVGSTFKPIVARAAELAFPSELATLTLTSAGHADGCHAHRGTSVDPMLGHCPPATLADDPTTADVHDYLEHSLNWYQAALGLVGLGLPAGKLARGSDPITLPELVATDLQSWPTSAPLQVADAGGPIVDGHGLVVAGARRTPLWTRIEQILGRPLCTLGDRASCERAADRADTCSARALPIDAPSRDLRALVSLGPDRLDVYPDDRPGQQRVPVREYFQLLRGSGVHPVGSLAQLADAFDRVVYDPAGRGVAASWFPAPAVGTVPAWSCAHAEPHAAAVLGAGGGLCAVVQAGGTAHPPFVALLADPRVVIYAAKTGTTDSLAEIARRPASCRAWNDAHAHAQQLACGKRPPNDSLFVIAFGVVTPTGVVPITLALQLQRGGNGAAARAAPAFVDAIATYFATH
jgi:hypothetical protein|nr:hypothetical protein [Kofleriaceae bacterium]